MFLTYSLQILKEISCNRLEVATFLTNLLDMYSDCRDISDRIHIPDFLEELLLGKYMVWILSKECEQIKFLCGKLLFLSVYPNTADSVQMIMSQSRFLHQSLLPG